MKECLRCGAAKPLPDFSVKKSAKDGLQTWCRSCFASWRKANPDLYREWVERNPGYERKKKYGISDEQFQAMLVAQNGRCTICSTTEPGGFGTWHVDHDHGCCPGRKSCGECVRSLLCSGCNTGLGLFGDDPDRLLAAVSYLRAHGRG